MSDAAGAPAADDAVRRLVHDLRTPLAVVDGFARLLERDADAVPAAQRAEYLGRIRAATREMAQLLDDARR